VQSSQIIKTVNQKITECLTLQSPNLLWYDIVIWRCRYKVSTN